MAVPGVLEEVGDRVGGGLGVEFQGDGAEIGVQFDHLALSFGGGGKNWAGEGRGQR
jgi:phage-related minor tail protein